MNKRKILLLIIALLGGIMISCGTKPDHVIDPDITAIPSPVTKWYDQKENVTEELSKEEDEIEEVRALTDPEMSEAFKVNENNPYAMSETFSGSYLYYIYEANKGSEADGDWFEKESKKFTYHEQYDPLNNENLNFEWDIELSEMKGTDPLSEAFNNYHQQLFEEQKALMEDHQKEVMEMEPEEINDHWLSIRFSMNIFTRASFKWGDIFTVVDMKNIHDRGCYPVIANFNSVSGKQYQLDDLFRVENYTGELIEIIMAKPGGSDLFCGVPLERADSLPFLIGYQGLLLFDDISEFSILFEWSDLENILKPEIWEVISKGRNAETAYQEFLNGQRVLLVEESEEDLLEYIFEDKHCGSVSMEDILEKLEASFHLEEYNNDRRIETIEYAYIDSYNDGSKELAVRFTFDCGAEHINIVFIIVYEEDALYLRHAFDSWNRYGADLYDYGLIKSWGSGGAFTSYDGETFLGKDGRAQIIYESVYDWGQYEPELFEQAFGFDGSAMNILKIKYRISDNEYVYLKSPEKDNMQEILGVDLTQENIDRKWEEYCKLYEQKNGKLSTWEEIDEQIRKRREELGISENWIVTTEPDWKLVENPAYVQHVKGMEPSLE